MALCAYSAHGTAHFGHRTEGTLLDFTARLKLLGKKFLVK